MPLGTHKAALFGVAGVSTGDVVLLSTQTASGASEIEFTSGIDSTYGEYIFKFYNINPDTSSNFQFEGSTNSGSSYGVTKTTTAILPYHNEDDSGTGLYYETNTDHAQSTSAQTLGSPANDADSGFTGELHLFSPASTTYVKNFYTTSSYFTSVPYAGNMMIGGYFNTTSAVDAVQFTMSSGNFDGTIKMWGVK